jgi:hypothetical protein
VVPKQLAQVARAINTLASASAPTNTRQVQGKAGQQQQQQQQQGANDAATEVADVSKRQGKATSQAAQQAAPPSVPDAVLPSLPAPWAESYAQAVVAALPAASPRAFCYLLRALSLDRVKRLLRAQKRLARPLMDHLASPSATTTTAEQQPAPVDSPSTQRTKAGATNVSRSGAAADKSQTSLRPALEPENKAILDAGAATDSHTATSTGASADSSVPSRALPSTASALLPGALAQVLTAEQATQVLSCGAQLVWPPDHPWLQV